MKINKKIFIGAVVVFIPIIIGISLVKYFEYSNNQHQAPSYSENSEASVASGPVIRNDEDLVGAIDNILVGRVTELVGTKTYFGRPVTLSNVEVIYNVKGNVRGTVLVQQEGANTEGKVRVVSMNTENPQETLINLEESLLLKPGNTYLLLVDYAKSYDGYALNYNSRDEKMLSDNTTLTTVQLNELARMDQRVHELLAAYVNENVWGPNILNRFDLLSEAEKKIVFDKFANLIPPRPVPEITPKNFDFSEPATENTVSHCMDGIDNDKDGLIDFSDLECKSFFKENSSGLCRDRADNDADGLTDARDPDCAQFYPQPAPLPPATPPAPSSTTYTAPAPAPVPPTTTSSATSTQ